MFENNESGWIHKDFHAPEHPHQWDDLLIVILPLLRSLLFYVVLF